MYAKTGEDRDYSVTASVELKKLFPNKKVKTNNSSTCGALMIGKPVMIFMFLILLFR